MAYDGLDGHWSLLAEMANKYHLIERSSWRVKECIHRCLLRFDEPLKEMHIPAYGIVAMMEVAAIYCLAASPNFKSRYISQGFATWHNRM